MWLILIVCLRNVFSILHRGRFVSQYSCCLLKTNFIDSMCALAYKNFAWAFSYKTIIHLDFAFEVSERKVKHSNGGKYQRIVLISLMWFKIIWCVRTKRIEITGSILFSIRQEKIRMYRVGKRSRARVYTLSSITTIYHIVRYVMLMVITYTKVLEIWNKNKQ